MQIDEKAMIAFSAELKRQDLMVWDNLDVHTLKKCLNAYEAAKAEQPDMTPKQIADYVAGTMALEGQGLTKEQRDEIEKSVAGQPVECRKRFEEWLEANPNDALYTWAAWQAAWDARPMRESLSQWQPMETAPKDGTVILAFVSESVPFYEGLVAIKWVIDEHTSRYKSPGNWQRDFVAGFDDGECNPVAWIPLPKLPRKSSDD